MNLLHLWQQKTWTKKRRTKSLNSQAMGEDTSGRSHSISALAEKAQQWSKTGPRAAPKYDDIKRATVKGAS